MKIIVKIIYRDDKVETFTCVDYPYFGEFVYIYISPIDRIYIPKESIARIESKIK